MVRGNSASLGGIAQMATIVHVERERTETDSPKNAIASEFSNNTCHRSWPTRSLTEIRRRQGHPE